MRVNTRALRESAAPSTSSASSCAAASVRQATKPSGRTSVAPSAPTPYSVSEPALGVDDLGADPVRLDRHGRVGAAARLAASLAARIRRAGRSRGRRGRASSLAAVQLDRRGAAPACRGGRSAARGSSHMARRRPARRVIGARAVAVAELDGGLVDDRHEVLLAEARVEPQDVARVGLLDGERPDRPPLGVVGVEQRRRRPCRRARSASFQARLCASCDAGVAAEAAGRRHDVAASPARKTRPVRKRARPTRRVADQRWTFSISTARSGAPSASRT